MGASFQVYRKEYLSCTTDNIAYTAVSRFRGYLLEMLDRNNGTDWYERWHWCSFEDKECGGNGEWDALLDEMHGRMHLPDGSIDDVVYGTLAFVDHSDCGGGWNSESCDAVAKAFCALLETGIVKDGYDRTRIGQLVTVFRDGSKDDCEVEIL